MKGGWERLEVGKGGRKYYNSISIRNTERKQNHPFIPGLVWWRSVQRAAQFAFPQG